MLKDEYKKIILDICRKHLFKPYQLYLFGSRARGDEYFCSDIDLAIKSKEDKDRSFKFALIKEDFEESKIPFFIDLVDIDASNIEMKESILRDGVLLDERKYQLQA